MEIATSSDVWAIAEACCTEKQLRVLELREKHGASIYQIGYMCDLSPSTVRTHLASAARNIRRALERRAMSTAVESS